jgi:hypothetical protein
VRIDSLPYNNVQTQGTQRRAWLRQHSPQHLEACATLMLSALQKRQPGASRSILILGAGACTEVPLAKLAHASDEIVLADFDLAAMKQGRDELSTLALRKHVRLVACDISGGVSANLARLIKRQPWEKLISQGAEAVFDAAADCIEHCSVPDPPQIQDLGTGDFGIVISSLVLSQLFSYPLLDILDHIQGIAPNYLGEQERHRRYQEATQAFRIRVIESHLHLLRNLVDVGGVVVLLTDMRGFVFNIYGTDHDAEHRRTMPLVPRTLPDLIRSNFTVLEESHWEWLNDLPEKGRLGRGYEVAGYLVSASE